MTDAPAGGGCTVAVVIPAAPLLLPEVSHAQPDAVAPQVRAARAAVATACEALVDVDAAVVLAAGTITGIHAAARSSLRGLGVPTPPHEQPAARPLYDRLRGVLELPSQVGPLEVDLAVVVRHLPAGLPVVPIALDAGTDRTAGGPDLRRLGARLGTALTAHPARTALVLAGDGSAARDVTSPGYLVDGAAGWDDELHQAVAGGDLAGLAALGPQAARRVHARGWAPLVVGLSAAQQLGFARRDVATYVVKGVGHLIGTLRP